jgi:hypothetical protein
MRSKRRIFSYRGGSGNSVLKNIVARTASHLLADRIINGRYSRRNRRTVYVKDRRTSGRKDIKRSLTRYRKRSGLSFGDKILLTASGLTLTYLLYNWYAYRDITIPIKGIKRELIFTGTFGNSSDVKKFKLIKENNSLTIKYKSNVNVNVNDDNFESDNVNILLSWSDSCIINKSQSISNNYKLTNSTNDQEVIRFSNVKRGDKYLYDEIIETIST